MPDVVWDDEAAADVVWDEPEAPGALESFGRGALQGVTLGFADEIYGGAKTLMGDDYATARDESRAAFQAAEEANPTASTVGRVGGGLATALVPGLGAANLGRAVAIGAGMGAAQGLGESEADLTKGEVGEALQDTAVGGAVGAGAGAVGHGVAKLAGKVLDKVANRGARGVADATAEERAKQALLQAKNEASALGKYRSAVQSASRDLEVLGREAAELPEGAVQQGAREFIESPQVLAVREQVVGNKLGTAPERLSEMAQLRGEHAALVAGREGLVDAATENAMKEPFRRQFAPRLATLGHRFLPMAAMGVGSALGSPEAGALAGGAMALASGRPGVIIRNLIRSPAARASVWGLVQRLATTSPEALGRWGVAISGALRDGSGPLAEALHGRALENDPEYQAKVLDMLNSGMEDTGGAQ